MRSQQNSRRQRQTVQSDHGRRMASAGDLFGDLLADMAELNETLIAAGYEGLSAEKAAAPAHQCPICDDQGWITHPVHYTHPDFGKPFPCRCKEAEIVQKRVNRLIGTNYVLEAYQGYTYESFIQRCGGDLVGKEDAYQASWEFGGGQMVSLNGTIKPLSSVYLWGSYGLGKTGLASLAMFSRAAAGVPCAAIDWRTFMADIKRTYGDKSDQAVSDERLITGVGGIATLMIDELGALSTRPTEHEIGLTERLIRLRHARNLPTIYTSNLSPRQLVEKFGEYIAQRIFERAHAIEIAGISVRF